MRKSMFILMMFVTSIALSPAHVLAAGLKEHSIVTNDTITLGDIFYGLKRNKDRVIGVAPRPGEELVINARTLLRVAIALDLDWRPQSANTHILLKREATVIDHDQITRTLKKALKAQGAYGDFEVSIPKEYHEIILPIHIPAEFEITRLNYDASRDKFEAVIAAPSAEEPIQSFHMVGYIHPVITVPILLGNVQHGSIISRNDIGTLTIREEDFSKDTIADKNTLIGMTARRMIVAGRPIRKTEIIAPQIVERGELVTLSLNQGAMNITTQVKALENGAKGDVIRVVNLSSNKTLQAQITGASEVVIVQ